MIPSAQRRRCPALWIVAAVLTLVAALPADAQSVTLLTCPNGGMMTQARHWDAGALRNLPDNPIEVDLRARCLSVPARMTPQNEEWYYGQARQADACSGPIGSALSNWGSAYPFLQDACVIHDMCYRSDQPRAFCDSSFVKNVSALCDNLGVPDVALRLPCATAIPTITTILAATHPRFESAYAKGQAVRQEAVGADNPDIGINLALTGTAWQNSTYQSFAGPEKAIDGNTTATWVRSDDNSVSHTGNEKTTAWTVNLGANRMIRRVVIFNGDTRAPANWRRLSGALVQCWRNDIPETSVKAFWLPNMENLPYISLDFNGAICGTVRVIHQEKSQYLVMAEVQVWGKPLPPSGTPE